MSDAVLDYIHELAVQSDGVFGEDDILDVYLAVSGDSNIDDPLEFTEVYINTSRDVLKNIDELIKMIG